MRKALYSQAHDKEMQKSYKTSKSKSKKIANHSHQLNKGKVLFSPGNPGLTEEDRIKLRQAQISNKEANRDKDFIEDVRRKYVNQEGDIYYSEPRMKPPGPRKRNPHLSDVDIDDVNSDPDLINDTQSIIADNDLPRIAELSVTDESIVKVDNLLTDVFRVVSNLKSAADQMLSRAKQENNTEAIHHSEQITWILEEAIEPWLQEVDSHLDGVIQGTPEGNQLEGKESSE